ncbi:MAG: hypothetical protein ACD_73C00702G0004 [uncultured bacterium]|nr:MAG: hypothetical protein ACD_73C00702G0004 [uncultured bacterium]
MAVLKGDKADDESSAVSRDAPHLRLASANDDLNAIVANDDIEIIVADDASQPVTSNAVLAPEVGALGMTGALTATPSNVVPLFGVR